MTIQPVPRMPRRVHKESVAVAAHFERLIATNALPPGSRLPSERDLAATLSVSRTTLREAMHGLETKRLIERTPGRGTIVLGPRPEALDLRQLGDHASERDHVAELRSTVEPAIAALAAQRATASNLLQLQDIVDQSSDRLRPDDSLRLDLEFHLMLAQAAGNPLLVELHSLVSEWAADVRRHSHSTKRGRRTSVLGHTEILEAVRNGDADAARSAMERHLGDVRRLIDQRVGQDSEPPPRAP